MFTFIKKIPFWICAVALIFVVAWACYANCLPNEMFWDDDDFILKNRFIKDWHYFPQFFTQNLVAGGYLVSNYWRPLLLTVFAIEWHLWKDWVYGWHAINITVHACAGMVLFFLINRISTSTKIALAVALLFVAHPVHNEAIVYVNSLGDSLSSLIVFSSLLLYSRFRQKGGPAIFSPSYYISLLLYPFALMAKETGFVLIGLLLLTDFLILQAHKPFWLRIKNIAVAAWPFLLVAGVYILLRATTLNFANSFNFYNNVENAFTSSILIRLFTFFKALTQYAAFLFFPYELKVERLLPWAQSMLEWDVLVGGAIFLSMLGAAFYFWKKQPWVSFGVGWFYIAILPTSNVLVPINALIYEHFLYVPMIGIVLIVVTLCLNLRNSHATLLKTLIIILLCFIALNFRRNLDWRTAIGFYEQLIQYRPDSYRVVNNLGMEYADKGFYPESEKTYLKAIALDPKNPVAYHNMGGTYRDTGRINQALASFKKAIELDPRFVFSYRSLADIYYRLGNLEASRQCLMAALSITPDDNNLQQALNEINARLKSK